MAPRKSSVTLKDLLAALRTDHPDSSAPRSFTRYNPDSGKTWNDGDVPRKGHVGELWWHNYNARPDITPPPPPLRRRRSR